MVVMKGDPQEEAVTCVCLLFCGTGEGGLARNVGTHLGLGVHGAQPFPFRWHCKGWGDQRELCGSPLSSAVGDAVSERCLIRSYIGSETSECGKTR